MSSPPSRPTASPPDAVAWLGLDAHARFSLLAWMDDHGRRRQHGRFPTGEAQLVKHLQFIPATTKPLALEECGLGRWLAQVAAPHVTGATVCDPRENPRLSRHHHKCDEEDGYPRAHLHRLGALTKVWQPLSDERAVFKCAAQAYRDAGPRQTALKLQRKAHHRQWGVIPTGSVVYARSGRGTYLAQIPQAGGRAPLQRLSERLALAREIQGKARRLMLPGGQKFPAITRLRTVPGVGRIGAHLFVAYIPEPSRFETPQQLYRSCRLGIRDRSRDGKPPGFQQLDRRGHGGLKAISYRAWLVAVNQKRGAIHQFYAARRERTGDETHARLNPRRKVLHTRWGRWKRDQTFDASQFLGDEAQPTAKASGG